MYRFHRLLLTALTCTAALFGCFAVAAVTDTPKQVNVEIVGAPDHLRDNMLALTRLGEMPCDIPVLQLRSKIKGAGKNLAQASHGLGYYEASWDVNYRENGQQEEDACWQVNISVTPGQRMVIGAIDIELSGEGTDNPIFKNYLTKLPVAPGDGLDHSQYEAVKNQIAQLAKNSGYLDGIYIHHKLRINKNTGKADYLLHFDTGPRYHFGTVTFLDNTIDDDLLRRHMPFREGDPVEVEKLIQFQSNLINSGYFESVDITQGPTSSEDLKLPLDVQLTPRSRYQTAVNVGFSTDIGPRLGYNLDNRRINSKGNTFNVNTQLSPVASAVTFNLNQPGRKPLSEKRQWSAGWQFEDTDTAEFTSYKLEAADISETGSQWMVTKKLSFLYEDFSIADEQESVMLLMPSIGINRSRADDSRYPRMGWRAGATVRGAVKGVVSDISMAQLEVDGKLILPLFSGRLLTRAGFATTAVDEFSTLPVSLRYFAGGDNSVRGWDYKSLGPEDANGDVTGGKHRITASVEMDHRVYKDYHGALFFDTGSAFDSSDFTLYKSVGVGARWFSPIGPIRIDLAFPLDEGGVRVHFSMGPDL